MRHHDDPNVQAGWDLWQQAILDQADHRISCQDGCSLMADVCETGVGYRRAEQQRWRDYHQADELAGRQAVPS